MRLFRVLKGLGAAAMIAGFGATSAVACGSTYVVERGDHLGRIAKNCGVTAQSILKANKLRDPSKLRIGQKLSIPGGEAGATKSAARSGDLDELKGEVINGRYCAQIVTSDGTRYGLVSPKLAFTSGKIVTVRGSMHSYSGCTPDRTMLVTTIMENGIDATDLSATVNVESVKLTN